MEKRVIIVTGSCGKIGKAIVKRLDKEFQIVGFELLTAIYASPSEELVPVDISSDESVEQAFMHIRSFYGNKIASVIHLAAYYSFTKKHSRKYETVTIKGTERLLKALQNFEVEQFIFSSTMLVHAPCKPGEKIDEDWPLYPKWDYPKSKVITEQLIHEKRGKIKNVAILRIAGVYDAHCGSIPISHQIARIYEKKLESHFFPGSLRHGASFVHLHDLVDAIDIAVHKREQLPSEVILLIGEPKTLSYGTMQHMIGKALFGREWKTYRIPKLPAKIFSWIKNHLPLIKKPFIKPWMIDFADDHYELNIAKAGKVLGWAPKNSLEEKLPKMVEELKADPKKWYKINNLKE